MKEWQELLDYIELYIYVDSKEETVIQHDPRAKKALAAYKRALSLLEKDNDFEEDDNLEKWEFDIALDCVRDMSEDERENVRNHMRTSEYHFEYAMWIRNQYIYPAVKHEAFSPDHISGNVMKKIFSIVSPLYDFRDRVMVRFFENSPLLELTEKYGEDQKAVFEEIYGKLSEKGYESSSAAQAELEEKLRVALGPDEFIKIYRDALRQCRENMKEKDQQDWYWNTHFPACHAMLYPLQANQIRALQQTGLFSQIECLNLKSREECRKYIDENLGLREDYADYMARCAWEVHSPLVTGRWREFGLYQLSIDTEAEEYLKKKGIDNLGKLCEMTFAELSAMHGIGMKTAERIKNSLETMGLKLKTGL